MTVQGRGGGYTPSPTLPPWAVDGRAAGLKMFTRSYESEHTATDHLLGLHLRNGDLPRQTHRANHSKS